MSHDWSKKERLANKLSAVHSFCEYKCDRCGYTFSDVRGKEDKNVPYPPVPDNGTSHIPDCETYLLRQVMES